MEATKQKNTMGKGQNQPEQITMPVTAQAVTAPMPALNEPSKIWTPPSNRSSDTETYRNWGINE